MPTRNGRELNERWSVGALHALYRESGDWYHVPRRFPAALFDAHGYVLFETEEELETDEILRSKKAGKDWLSVRKPGISSLVNYVKMDAAGVRETSPEEGSKGSEGVPLREYDESERLAVQESRTVLYRNRHRKITNAFVGDLLHYNLYKANGRRTNMMFCSETTTEPAETFSSKLNPIRIEDHYESQSDSFMTIGASSEMPPLPTSRS